MSFDQSLHSSSQPETTDFSITSNGTRINVLSVSVDNKSLYLDLGQPIYKNDHLKISYSVGPYHIRDLEENSVRDFSNRSALTDFLPGPRAVMNNPGTETVQEITENSQNNFVQSVPVPIGVDIASVEYTLLVPVGAYRLKYNAQGYVGGFYTAPNQTTTEWSNATLIDLESVIRTIEGTGYYNHTDDAYIEVPIAFDFNFYGINYDEVFLGTNGYITFGAGDSGYTNYSFPSSGQ
ncbi:hypothetical protein JCM17380_14400 [Desulfosporosinus burensis]